MDFMKSAEKVILTKIETVYGTDPVPTGALNAILTSDFSIAPMENQKVDRNTDRPGLGASPSVLAGKHVTCGFKLEAIGSGTVAVAPAFGPVLRACQMAQTITPVTGPVEYDPVSGAYESATLYAHLDGILHKILGFRGAAGFELAAGALPYFTVDGMGLFAMPTDTAPPAADFSAFLAPKPVEDAETPIATLNGVDLTLNSFVLNKPGNVKYRNLVNQEAVRVAGPRAYTGRAEVLAPSLATFNPYALASAHTLTALQIIHGTVANSKVQIDAPKVQITGVTKGSIDDEDSYQLDLLFTATDAGDDDIKFTFN